MAKRHFLYFFIRNREDMLVCEVREKEARRLETVLDDVRDVQKAIFFWCDTVDGRSVIVNLAEVQAVRFLWEVAALPQDTSRNEGMVQIQLRGRREPIETGAAFPDQMYDLFSKLENDPEAESYPKFADEDNEVFQLKASEVLWIIAPTHLLDEGESIIAEEDGLAGAD